MALPSLTLISQTHGKHSYFHFVNHSWGALGFLEWVWFLLWFFFPLDNPLQHFAVGILAKHQSWQILSFSPAETPRYLMCEIPGALSYPIFPECWHMAGPMLWHVAVN